MSALHVPTQKPLLSAPAWSAFFLVAIFIAVLAPIMNVYLPPTHWLHMSDFWVSLIGKIMCYAICALAMDLIWGFTGILSLGHGLFFSPVILWAVATINQLRLIPANEHALLDIIPVDYATEAIIKLLFAKRNHSVYHISCGAAAATTAYKVTKNLEAYFTDLPPFHFVHKPILNQMKHWTRNRLQPDSELYKYPVYLDYWEKAFADSGSLRILFAGLDPYLEFMELGQVFDNTRLLNDVAIEQSPAADIYINNCMTFLERIDVLEGALDF